MKDPAIVARAVEIRAAAERARRWADSLPNPADRNGLIAHAEGLEREAVELEADSVPLGQEDEERR